MSSLLKRVLHLSIFYAIGPSRDEGSPRSGLRWSPTLCHPLLIQAFVTSLFTSFFTIPDKPLSLNSMWTSSLQKLTIPQHPNNPYLKQTNSTHVQASTVLVNTKISEIIANQLLFFK